MMLMIANGGACWHAMLHRLRRKQVAASEFWDGANVGPKSHSCASEMLLKASSKARLTLHRAPAGGLNNYVNMMVPNS